MSKVKEAKNGILPAVGSIFDKKDLIKQINLIKMHN